MVFNAYLLLILLKEKVKTLAEALMLRASITCLPSSPLEPSSKCRMRNESLDTAGRVFSKLLTD